MIEIKNLSQGYKGTTVLSGIRMTIKTGEFVILIGSSGCGKTTLLKTINKLNPIRKGDILIDGKSVQKIPDNQLRRRIGYVIQDGGLSPPHDGGRKHSANSYVSTFVGKNRLWDNPGYIEACDIMKKDAVHISKSRTVLQALQAMNHYMIDSLLVTSGKRHKLEGIVWLEDLQQVYEEVKAGLPEEYDMELSAPLGYSNTYVFAVPRREKGRTFALVLFFFSDL